MKNQITKQTIIQEIERMSDADLIQVLDYIKTLKAKAKSTETTEVWQIYLQSEQERQAVYRRLAQS